MPLDTPKRRLLALCFLAGLAGCAGSERAPSGDPASQPREASASPAAAEGASPSPESMPATEEGPMTAKVEKSDAEWRKELTPEQYRVLRQAGTERAFGAGYEEFKKQGEGVYRCAGCGALLFTSKEKFDSHCGWPSFYDPADAQNVVLHDDLSHGMVRTEVTCARCGGHLGHVFRGEGYPTPTDQRFCINAVSIEFVPAAEAEGERGGADPGGE